MLEYKLNLDQDLKDTTTQNKKSLNKILRHIRSKTVTQLVK